MKKILLFIIGCFIVQTSFANVDSLVTSVKKTVIETANGVDTSKLSHKIYSDVREVLIGLSSSLKVGAEFVYEVMVKQQIVYSIIHTILGSLSFYLLLNFISNYKSEEKWGEDGDPTFLGILRGFQVGIGFILFLVFIFNVDTIVTGFINPHYGAIKEIIGFIDK